MKSRIFRQEAVDAQKTQWLGEVLLARPLTLTFYTVFAVLVACAVIAFITYGEYTKKEKVVGKIVSTRKLAKIYAPVIGTVVNKHVDEGDLVKEGQVLYVISGERVTTGGDTQAAIAEKLSARRDSLTAELSMQRIALQTEREALQRKIIDIKSQLSSSELEIEAQSRRLRLSEASLQRFRQLASEKYVSAAQVSDREIEILEQQARLETLRRNRITLTTQLSDAETALKNAPTMAFSRLAGIERGIASAEQESLENEARRQIVVTARHSGRATAVLADVGQSVNTNTALLSIVPADSRFEGYLYVPSRAMGFIRQGGRAMLRYAPYPYQKFGQHGATIEAISKAPLAPADLQTFNIVAQEPLYRITVQLDKQTVMAYGQELPLQEGTSLEADLQLDRRKIYEWLFEPLYSIVGRL